MRTIGLIIIILSASGKYSKGQNMELEGQYVFERKGEMFSAYIFSADNVFTSILGGDMGTFYGEGKFETVNNWLILNYDSTRIAKRVGKKYYVIPTGTDTLTILNRNKRKVDLECDYTGQIETYKRLKYRSGRD